MIRVTEHVRRAPATRDCDGCERPIEPGETYRIGVFIRCEWLAGPAFQMRYVHPGCIPEASICTFEPGVRP